VVVVVIIPPVARPAPPRLPTAAAPTELSTPMSPPPMEDEDEDEDRERPERDRDLLLVLIILMTILA